MNDTLNHENNIGAITNLYDPRGLRLEVLERACPAIFASEPDSCVSANYSFIPTKPILEAIVADGWVLTGASNQLKGRGSSARVKPHGAHLLRFRREDTDITASKDGFFEIVLMNSHDRTKRYTLQAGIFRMICTNGLIVGNHALTPTKITHYNIRQTQDDLVTGARALAACSSQLSELMDRLRQRMTTKEEQIAFASKAIETRYRGSETSLSAATVLLPRRPEDEGDSLWSVFNRVQENLIVGGMNTGRGHTRPVVSLFESTMLNVKLWQQMEALADAPQLALN